MITSKVKYRNMKALVKNTGEILDIKSKYLVSPITISINLDEADLSKLENKTEITKTYFILSDKKKYNEDDIVVGIDNIRDYRIDNLTN